MNLSRAMCLLLAVFALSACSAIRSGAGVIVDGEPIAMSEVSQTAEVYCVARAASQQQVDGAQARQDAALGLAVNAIAADVVQSRSLDVDESLAELSEGDVTQIRSLYGVRAEDAIEVFTKSQRLSAQLVAIGADETGQTPNADILEDLATVGNSFVSEQLEDRDVQFAPSLGLTGSGDRIVPGRLSVPDADTDRRTSAQLPASVGCRAS